MNHLTKERLVIAALMAVASVGLIACEAGEWQSQLYGYNDPYGYGDGRSSSSGGSNDGGGLSPSVSGFDPACVDSTGFGGRGCYKCAPQTNEQLLNACTSSHFESFDNAARISGFNPSNPRPALPALGPTPPAFVGGSDTTDPLPPAPACPLASKPNPVMVLGATGLPLETIAKAMGPSATIFYLEKSSCDGVASVLLDAPKLSGEVVYYDTDGTANRCTLSAPQPADIGLSALFAETCAGQSGLSTQLSLPNDVGDFLGPANTVMFTVPATSKERAISAEAAYRVYGWGSQSGVSPWTDENFVFRRTPSSGNQQTVALSLGLPADAFRGRDSNGSSNMLNALRTSADPAKTLAISSSEIVDVNRDVLKSLAYQHYSQAVAFYPDSDPAMLDRQNVRDGHYFMWLPLHVFARTRGGEPVAIDTAHDAAVKTLVYVMTSRQEPPVPTVDLLGAVKRLGNVPPCAMHVKRSREAAPLEPANPQYACDCAFETSAPGTTPTACTACASSLDCPSNRPSCRFGYCEAGSTFTQ
jgi:hypothetical protein